MDLQILNDYKKEFFWKRFSQTVLGGARLRIGYSAPWYVYVLQVVLFFVPFVVGGICTLIAELGSIRWDVPMYICACIMLVYSGLLQLYSHAVRNRHLAVVPIHLKNGLLEEEDQISFTSCCSSNTIQFIIPGKKYKINVVIHSFFTGITCGLGMAFLLPTRLYSLFESSSATWILFVFGWMTVCIALYSLIVNQPIEPALFRPADRLELGALMRPFYVLCFVLTDRIFW